MAYKAEYLVLSTDEIYEIVKDNPEAKDDFDSIAYYKDNLVPLAGWYDLENAIRATLPDDQKGMSLLMCY